jgi:hypothetical protein
VTRSELVESIKEQITESDLEDVVDSDTFAEDLADRLETDFGILDEEDDEEEEE